jgi:hypothetical protein
MITMLFATICKKCNHYMVGRTMYNVASKIVGPDPTLKNDVAGKKIIEELVSEIGWESWLNAQSQSAIESSKWGLLRLGDPSSTRYDIIM